MRRRLSNCVVLGLLALFSQSQSPIAVLPVTAAVAAALKVLHWSRISSKDVFNGTFCQEDGLQGSLPICALQGGWLACLSRDLLVHHLDSCNCRSNITLLMVPSVSHGYFLCKNIAIPDSCTCRCCTGDQIALQSAADLLAAGRFQNFTNPKNCSNTTIDAAKPGCVVYSSSTFPGLWQTSPSSSLSTILGWMPGAK